MQVRMQVGKREELTDDDARRLKRQRPPINELRNLRNFLNALKNLRPAFRPAFPIPLSLGMKHNISLLTAISLCILLVFTTPGQGGQTREYSSPNRQFRARVIALPDAPYGSGESRVEIHAASGALLCSRSYGSWDGEHGFGVERAAWTPDSRFFVYSMSSSGGHQAWHFPTDFIAIQDRRIRRIDQYVGPITDPEFKLRAPDIVQVVGRRREDLEEATSNVSLRKLITKKERRDP